MEFWIVYDLASGNEVWRGSGSAGSAEQQELPAGCGLVVVPPQMVQGATLDLEVLRGAVAAQIDAQAEAIRRDFLTPGAGQAMTYQRKEAEARAWTADQRTRVPFLDAEAAACGIPVGDVAAEVIRQADRWTIAGAAIEGRRMGAKAALAEAKTLGAIVQASKVDWSMSHED
jgi:hypothetical protein